MAATDFLSQFLANISCDFCLHVWSWNFSTPLHRQNPSELSVPFSITDIYREVSDCYHPKDGCPFQSNRFVRYCLFQEFPVIDTKKSKINNKI